MTTTAIRPSFKTAVQFLNQPLIKERIKNTVSTVAFAFGVVEAYDIYQILHGQEIPIETRSDASKWMQVANKVILVCAKISLILSAASSRPGVFILSTVVGYIFSSGQLRRIFGPNAIFEINSWHPRHVCSIAAVILALPSVVQFIYKSICWAYRKDPLAATKIHWMALFNTITSRPVQHLGNQLCKSALRG